MIRHIVLFRVRDGATEKEVDLAIDRLSALGDLPSVDAWHVERSLDNRKGLIIIEDASFTSEDAFTAFRNHPMHLAVGEMMTRVSDWWVGDYVASSPTE